MNWKRIRAKAYAYGRKRGLNDEAEDFAQYYCLRYFENASVNMEYVWVDFMRNTFGNTRYDAGKLKSDASRHYKFFWEECYGRHPEPIEKKIAIPTWPLEEWRLNKRQALVYCLVVSGYSIDQMIILLNIDKASIYYHINNITQIIVKVTEARDARAKGRLRAYRQRQSSQS